MLDVLYRSRECLDHPESYHMEFLTYVKISQQTHLCFLEETQMTLCDYVTKT